MRSIAINTATAPAAAAAKAPLFWLCAMGAAAEVPELLLAGVAEVVKAVDATVAEDASEALGMLEALEILQVPEMGLEEQTPEKGTVTS
jgi:hypothetical protein